MRQLFSSKRSVVTGEGDFGYLKKDVCYFDSSCQTLRPQKVIDAEIDYYHHYNACGGRVHYRWGQEVDARVKQTRERILAYLGKSAKEYQVAFTLNTTYGINLVLNQLDTASFTRIITSDIEHNSVQLPTINLSRRAHLERIVLSRNDDGSVDYEPSQLNQGIVIMNSVSNIDGRQLLNMEQLANDVHQQGGIICIDAAQAMLTQRDLLSNTNFDCLFASGHKMYGPSVGFIVIKKLLLSSLSPQFIGGGMVESVTKDSYTLISDEQQLYTRLEPGLQDWAAIIGLHAAFKWLIDQGDKRMLNHQELLSRQLFDGLKELPGLILLNKKPSSILAWYIKGIDSHQVSLMYSAQDIMARSGYFCCHYYLKEIQKLPPLVRTSIGLHNTAEQIDKLLSVTRTIIQTLR